MYMKRDRGLSLIEIVVVIGLLTAIAGLSMLVSIDTYRSYLFRGERDKVVQALQKARSRAIHNICFGAGCSNGRPHGVNIDSSTGTVTNFQGTSVSELPSVNDPFSLNDGITISGLSDVVFSQLSGDAAPEGNITITDEVGHISVISINSEGQILWTN